MASQKNPGMGKLIGWLLKKKAITVLPCIKSFTVGIDDFVHRTPDPSSPKDYRSGRIILSVVIWDQILNRKYFRSFWLRLEL
jgi:hypothetical protein